MASFKSDPEAVKQACTRLKIAGGFGEGAAPPIANTMLTWLVPETLICCQASLHKHGVVGRTLFCKHTARIEIGAASKQTQAVKQACTRLKTARGFEGAAPPLQAQCSLKYRMKAPTWLASGSRKVAVSWGYLEVRRNKFITGALI